MNLLLLLSALLSALTGAAAGVRAPQAEQAITWLAGGAVAAAKRPATIADRPLAERPTLAAVAPESVVQPFTLIAAVPLFLGRRRE